MSSRAARLLFCLGVTAGALRLRGADEVTLLPPVWVTAARMEPFYLATSGGRIWLKTSAGPMADAMYVGFRGGHAKDGDEVIRIGGRSVLDMRPGEALRLILGVFSGRESAQLELEVRGHKEIESRIVTIDRFWSPASKGWASAKKDMARPTRGEGSKK